MEQLKLNTQNRLSSLEYKREISRIDYRERALQRQEQIRKNQARGNALNRIMRLADENIRKVEREKFLSRTRRESGPDFEEGAFKRKYPDARTGTSSVVFGPDSPTGFANDASLQSEPEAVPEPNPSPSPSPEPSATTDTKVAKNE